MTVIDKRKRLCKEQRVSAGSICTSVCVFVQERVSRARGGTQTHTQS